MATFFTPELVIAEYGCNLCEASRGAGCHQDVRALCRLPDKSLLRSPWFHLVHLKALRLQVVDDLSAELVSDDGLGRDMDDNVVQLAYRKSGNKALSCALASLRIGQKCCVARHIGFLYRV